MENILWFLNLNFHAGLILTDAPEEYEKKYRYIFYPV